MSDPRKVTRYELERELRNARDLIDRLIEPTRRGAFDRCDCGHNKIDHGLLHDGIAAGFRPCLKPGCDCTDFDDNLQAWAEFERKRKMAEADALADQQKREAERPNRLRVVA